MPRQEGKGHLPGWQEPSSVGPCHLSASRCLANGALHISPSRSQWWPADTAQSGLSPLRAFGNGLESFGYGELPVCPPSNGKSVWAVFQCFLQSHKWDFIGKCRPWWNDLIVAPLPPSHHPPSPPLRSADLATSIRTPTIQGVLPLCHSILGLSSTFG